ncbi:hypothetical protein DFH09DRAFT_1170654 [Mycena vulgaris]|nr:hypothetical protein DFH09DRAFT_1170654 [Mycena vulgaris]
MRTASSSRRSGVRPRAISILMLLRRVSPVELAPPTSPTPHMPRARPQERHLLDAHSILTLQRTRDRPAARPRASSR